MSVIELTETGIKKFISTGHVVIKVFAQDCNPCKTYAPAFLEVSEEMEGVKFGMLQLFWTEDKRGFLPSEFKRTWLKTAVGEENYGAPTTVVFKDGKLLLDQNGKKSIARGAITDKTRLKYFIENGEMPARPVNPLIAALSPEIKAALLEKESLFSQISDVRNNIDRLNQIVQSNQATEEDRLERMWLTEKMDVLNADLQFKSQHIKELMSVTTLEPTPEQPAIETPTE